MLRFVNICLVLALVAFACVIYEGKYEARALDEDIDGLRKNIETERDAVAELRAEWSVLNRPERIERLAEKHLKLVPARPTQLVTLDTVSESDFERVRTETADESLPAASAPPTKVKSVAVPGVASAHAAPADDDLPASTKTITVKTVPIKAGPAAQAASTAPVAILPPPVTVSPPEE